MKKHYFRNTILISSFIFFLAIVFSCGTYQGSSYYTSDGIYGGTSISENETNDLNNSSFYKDVFNKSVYLQKMKYFKEIYRTLTPVHF